MGREQTKLDLVIGALDRFTGPLSSFAQRIQRAGDAVNRFKAQASGMDNATGFSQLSNAASSFGSSLLNVGQQVGGFFTRIAGAAGKLSLLLGGAGGGILGLATSVGAAGENMGIFAQKAGVTIESFQKIAYGASFANIQAEEMSVMLGKLGNQIQQTALGNEDLQKAFKAAGVSVKDSTGKLKNADQMLVDLSDTFAKMQDGPTKNALAIKLFGEEGLKLLPFLNQGSTGLRQLGKDAERLGIVFDQDGSNKSAEFNKSLGDVQYALKGLGYTIGLETLPVVQGILGEFKEWVVANRVILGQNVRQWVESFAQRLPDIVQGMRDVGNGISTAVDWLGKLSDLLGGTENLILTAAAVMSGPLLSALLGAASAFISLGVAIMTTPVGWIMAAVAAIAGAAYLIYKHWEPIKTFFSGLWDGISEAFKSGVGMVSSAMDKITSLVPDWMRGDSGSSSPAVTFEGGIASADRDAQVAQPSPEKSRSMLLSPKTFEGTFAPADSSSTFGKGFAPAGMGAQMAQSSRGLNTTTTTTSVEKFEMTVNAGPGISIQGGEHAKGVTVNQNNMGYQRHGD